MRNGMSKQEYINTIIQQIHDKTARAEIELELMSHIDDREEYYREIGYDSDTAAEMAIERMGSPELAAEGLAKIHKKYRKAPAVIAAVNGIIVILLFWLIAIFYTLDDALIYPSLLEALSLMYIIGISVLGKRCNSRVICTIALIYFFILYGGYLYLMNDASYESLCSGIILKIVCLLTGDLECFSAIAQVGRIKVAPWLTYLTIAFYSAIFILLIFVLISVCKLREPTYGLRTRKFSRAVFKCQKCLWILLHLQYCFLLYRPCALIKMRE